jgi:hypothetical protein
MIVSGAITLLANNPPANEAKMATDFHYPERLNCTLDDLQDSRVLVAVWLTFPSLGGLYSN